jgi:hypothetical protein
MGTYTFDLPWAMELIKAPLRLGVAATLREITQQAIELAPIRKQGRRKKRTTPVGGVRTKHEFPIGRNRTIAVTGGQMWKAFSRLPTHTRKDGTKETITRAQFRQMRTFDRSQNKPVIEALRFEERKAKSSSGKPRKVLRGSEKGGGLRDGIEVYTPQAGKGSDLEGGFVVRGYVKSTAIYSRYVEFPTRRTAAQPFLLPAFKAARSRLKANIKAVKGG